MFLVPKLGAQQREPRSDSHDDRSAASGSQKFVATVTNQLEMIGDLPLLALESETIERPCCTTQLALIVT
jgi:hypothetical protein